MNCEQAHERWHRRKDEGGTDAQLDAHIASCGKCRAYDVQMRLILSALDDLAAEPLPKREAVPSKRPLKRRTRRLPRVAAGIALLVGTSWWVATNGIRLASPVVEKTKIVEGPTEGASIANGSPEGLMAEKEPRPRFGLALRGESAGRFLAVATPTGVPNVQLYWLYPIVQPSGAQNGTTP